MPLSSLRRVTRFVCRFTTPTGRHLVRCNLRLRIRASASTQKNLHVFERFYQVDSRSNRTYEGTGIGLALVNELVKVLEGTIPVASIQGVGTTFTVALPLVEIREHPLVSERLPMMSSGATETRWLVDQQTGYLLTEDSEPKPPVSDNILLIIDDNADIRAYVRSIFEQDYQIIEGVDGQDGLEKATATLPNIVICDLMMPRLDGFGFCRALKIQEATSHIPVVMLTAKATVENRIEGFELGADDYLTKPFNRPEIQARVRNLIDKQEHLQLFYYGKNLLRNEPAPLPANDTGKCLSAKGQRGY